jgi:hypothetical protein
MREPAADPRHCPHIDRNDPRCTSRFALGEVEQMFAFCCSGFHGCAMFHRLNMERRFAATTKPGQPTILQDRGMPAAMQATIHGKPPQR